MEFKLGDLVAKELTVVRLETAAALYQSLHDGFSRAAKVISAANAKQ